MKEYFKNFTLQKFCSLILGVVFIAFLFIMAIGSRHRVLAALREADGKTVVEVRDTIDSTYNDGIYRKYDYVNICGLSARLMGMKNFNSVIKLNDGSLTDYPGVMEYDEYYAAELKHLNEYLQPKNIDMLYVQVPTKGGENSGLLPKGVADCGDLLYDSFANSLKKFDIDTINVRKNIADRCSTVAESYYVTDHHWKIETAFLTYADIINFFNENYGTDIDKKYTDINNFETEVYEDIFLGSLGKRTGLYYAGVDDFELIVPKQEIDSNIRFDIISKNEVRDGNFREALLEESYLSGESYFELNPYAVYLGGNYAMAKITNADAPCDKKIMVLTDSSGYPVMSFMSLAFKEIKYVDLRYYRDGKTFVELLEEYSPDILLFTYGMPRILDGVSYDFFNVIDKPAKEE